MYMQIVLQRVDGTDKETFPLIKMLKFLSVRRGRKWVFGEICFSLGIYY